MRGRKQWNIFCYIVKRARSPGAYFLLCLEFNGVYGQKHFQIMEIQGSKGAKKRGCLLWRIQKHKNRIAFKEKP